MSCSSMSTAPNNEISSAGSRKFSSTNGLSRLSLNLLTRCIENVLSAITNQGLGCKIIDSGTELRDLVQPVTSDFSKLFEGISEGAKMFSDEKFLNSPLSTEAHSMAVDVVKGLGNAHWVAGGLLAIANVLERFDNISANDRECIDLLKDMLKLGKYLKQMKDLNVKFHKEVLDDMREAVQLILSGAILCRSFITSNKLSKLLLTGKIREELNHVRGKVNSMEHFPHLKIQMWVKDIQPFQTEFKRNELKMATKGFSQLIGKGSSASVYSGILSDGRRVAVKIMRTGLDERVWMNELSILSKLRHRNIMELVGYCFEQDLMLVFEYMSRDLHSVICGEDDMIIDWPTRQNIILDIIRGVSYLQEGANECIAHRDIKPTNILLDENLNAKIGDFGLARILQPGDAKYANKEISTDGRVFLKDIYNFPSYETCSIFGTCGYVDPESRQTLIVTLKTDIYSFGVLLLNVVSGRPAMGTNESTLLSEQALKLLGEDRLTELIDPRLLNREGLINSSTILRTIKIALSCIEFDSERRPSVLQVLKMLSEEEEISIPTSPLLKR